MAKQFTKDIRSDMDLGSTESPDQLQSKQMLKSMTMPMSESSDGQGSSFISMNLLADKVKRNRTMANPLPNAIKTQQSNVGFRKRRVTIHLNKADGFGAEYDESS